MKFHVDYQNSTDPSNFNLNKERSWKFFFTSPSRIQCNTVWGNEYTEEPPMFYSDKESTLKHAKKFALTYSLSFLPLCAMYIFAMGKFYFTDFLVPQRHLFIGSFIIYAVLCIELGSFAMRTILYYFRVKKSFAEK